MSDVTDAEAQEELTLIEESGSRYESLADAQDRALPILADLIAQILHLRPQRDSVRIRAGESDG